MLSVNLARGAAAMARDGVLVRRLNAIENLGSMDVLCTDKTGTLTEGVVHVDGAFDWNGHPDPDVLRWAAINAGLEAGIASPLDRAILDAVPEGTGTARKLGELPFDFARRRSTVIVERGQGARLVTKGSFASVIDICTQRAGGALDASARDRLTRLHEEWAAGGIRVLAVAVRDLDRRTSYTRDDEADMTWLGCVTFLDRPKADARDAVAALRRLGVSVKMLSGDNALVARHVAGMVGLRADRVISGRELIQLDRRALWTIVNQVDVFAEIEPTQKERIIAALRQTGHVVGFLGDGVNDAPAMHAADTSLSVDTAVAVARETADFVLLRQSLDVIRKGIEEGRRTFANTMKYILTTTSANLGNMVSMAIASLMLPYLPLLASQILLNNFLSDIPAIGIADDAVDAELVARPERWNMAFIGRFMVGFGLLSSLFDLCTFLVLLGVFSVSPDVFRTAWFVESLLSELAIALVVRTRGSCFASRPGRLLLWLTVMTAVVALVIPYVPRAGALGFVPLPFGIMLAMALIVVAYLMATEAAKRLFFARAAHEPRHARAAEPA
ncbi:MAG: HAD-IC family P-type ATPase [Vicinamibacterales bacterium]